MRNQLRLPQMFGVPVVLLTGLLACSARRDGEDGADESAPMPGRPSR